MIVLADTSAWVELLRDTGSATERAIRQRLAVGEVAVTDLIIMETLAGATNAARLAGIQAALNACRYVGQRRLTDAVAAAEVYRVCRRGGETPRQLADCLVGAIAMRSGMPVLHNDRDYDVIARHTDLQVTRA